MPSFLAKKPASAKIRQNAVLAAEKSVLTRPRWIGLQRSRSARETNEVKHPAHHLLYLLPEHFLLKNVPFSNFPEQADPIFKTLARSSRFGFREPTSDRDL
jgi:hypothetical protein